MTSASLTKTRLIVINRYFYPDESATSQMLGGVLFALPPDAFDITVLCSNQLYDDARAELLPREEVEGITIHRLPTSRHGRAALLGRAMDYLSFYVLAVWKLLGVVRRGDIVIAKTDPPLLALAIWPVTALKRAKLVNWLQDIFPETATELGIGRNLVGRAGFWLLRRLRNLTLRHAAATIVIGERMAARVRAFGVPEAKLHRIPNFADGALITPVSHSMNTLRAAWNLGDDFVIGYSGNLGRAHDIDTFLAAMTLIEARITTQDNAPPPLRSIRWLFIGGGVQSRILQDKVRERGLSTVLFRPYQPRELLSQSLCVPDLHLISLRPDLEGLIVPSKYYGIAAAGRPACFIGDTQGEIGAILRESGTGMTVREGDGAALADAILAYAGAPMRCLHEGKTARQLFERQFERHHAVQRWLRVIGQISGS